MAENGQQCRSLQDMNLEEFCRLLAVINEREGFSKVEYDRAILALFGSTGMGTRRGLCHVTYELYM